MTTHHGAFDRLTETYGWLGREFIPASGMHLRRSPALEIYLNDPERTPPEQLITDVLLPVDPSPRRRAQRTG